MHPIQFNHLKYCDMKAVTKLFGALAMIAFFSGSLKATELHSDSLVVTTSIVETEAYETLFYEGKKLQCRIIEHKDNIIAIHYATSEQGIVKIKIVNEETDQTVYIDKVHKRSLAVKKYDLSHLPSGKYLVEVSYGSEIAAKFIQVRGAEQ